MAMNAIDLIKAGRLIEARRLLVEEVKSTPADAKRRTLLFQVLIFLGEWDKAIRHLETIAVQDPSRDAGVQTYRNMATAEKERAEVMQLNQLPSFLPETPLYFETYYTGLKKLVEKSPKEAKKYFDQIHAQRPTVSGTVNGKSFTGFCDTDTFLTPFLEAIVHDRYVWVPFESVRELAISPPKTLFDLIWAQARITSWEGLTMNCFLPVLYPDSYQHEDERIKLGRMTDWMPLGGGLSKGVGQHVFQIGEEEMAILEVREALFDYK
jgi:type VI secretion system protein ImpE